MPATPRCPKGAYVDFVFVQCASCGAVIAAAPNHNVREKVEKLAAALGISI